LKVEIEVAVAEREKEDCIVCECVSQQLSEQKVKFELRKEGERVRDGW
jgi:hypothetical protein